MALKDKVKPSLFTRLAWPFQSCLHKAETELEGRSSYELKKKKRVNTWAYSQIYKGVVQQHYGYWGAQIYTNNERIRLGTFKLEEDAALAYDRASIMLKTSDSPRNILTCPNATYLEEKFQSHYDEETILELIKYGSYQSWFNDYLTKKPDKENDDDLPVPFESCDCGYCCGFARVLFEKELTPSDVGKLNRLLIPKKNDVKVFPPVADNDEATLYDFHDKEWSSETRSSCEHEDGNNNCAYSQRYRSVVHQLQNGLWVAQIYTNNQCIWLGTFYYKEDVAIACLRALIKLKCSKATYLEAKFQTLYDNRERIKGKSYFYRGFAGWLLFEKELTPSDVGKFNRLLIPKEYAVKFFPPPAGNDEVILTFYDIHNKEWMFRYCYWKSCQSYVFTRGWNQFVKEKGLMAKDDIACYFDEDIGVGRICYRPNPERGLVVSDEVIQTSDLETKSLVREHTYLDQETSHEVIQTSHVETKSLVREHKYLDQETSLEVIQEPSHEVIQTSNEETKEFRLFGVQIAY